MYNDTLNGSTEKRSSELPDAVGPMVQLQEKLFVPVKEYPDVSTIFCLITHTHTYTEILTHMGYLPTAASREIHTHTHTRT